MILLALSVNKAVAVALGIFTWTSVALRLPMRFRLMLPGVELFVVEVDPVVVPVVGVVVELTLLCRETVALVGGLMPSVRSFSRRTCMIATSTTTSDFALS